jgi:uncharacterized protein
VGERSGYQPGTFCWTDLTTTDQDAAKSFYSALFGWQAEDMPIDEGMSYSMMRLDGRDVAAISPQPPQQREAGVPALWNSYISVQDADATVQRAKELGGTAHADAFDVMQAGRMGVIQDPQGAFFLAWQPREHHGAQLVNAPGALVWNELQSPDLEASISFYGQLFGWDLQDAPGMNERYVAIRNGEINNGGMRAAGPNQPPSWLVYFGVEDIDTAVARVQELGGGVLVPPTDIQIAKFAVVRDPQGAVFALYAGQLEP